METSAYFDANAVFHIGVLLHLSFISLHHDGIWSPPAAISRPKIHANAVATGAPPLTPLGELAVLGGVREVGLGMEGQ